LTSPALQGDPALGVADRRSRFLRILRAFLRVPSRRRRHVMKLTRRTSSGAFLRAVQSWTRGIRTSRICGRPRKSSGTCMRAPIMSPLFARPLTKCGATCASGQSGPWWRGCASRSRQAAEKITNQRTYPRVCLEEETAPWRQSAGIRGATGRGLERRRASSR
jgi:hypothetical protein